jgi:YD repeat-containing protein
MPALIRTKLDIAALNNFGVALLEIRRKLKKAVLLTERFIGSFVCLTLFALNAHAQYPSDPPAPPVRFNFSVTTDHTITYDVPTRFDLCTAFMSEMNPKPPGTPTWTNPRLPPAGTGGANPIALSCWFTSRYGDPDQRTPGRGYCGESVTKLSPAGYVVDAATTTCVCPQGTKYYVDANKCVKTTQLTGSNAPPAKPANNGPPPACCGGPRPPIIGEPINPGTGNMWHVETDFTSLTQGGLKLIRVYNSTPMSGEAFIPHSFGARWTSTYDTSLRQELPATATSSTGVVCWQRTDTSFIWCEPGQLPEWSSSPTAVSISRADGKRYYFNLVNEVWQGSADTNDRLTAIYSSDKKILTGWAYTSSQGDTVERYDQGGLLLAISERSGITQKLTYSDGTTNDTNISRMPSDAPVCTNVQAGEVLPAGRLVCVTDQWGRQLQFEYDTKGHVVKAVNPKGQAYFYEYDGPSGGCAVYDASNRACTANNLTKVTYPDGNNRTYFYNEAAQINNGSSCAGVVNVAAGLGPFANSWTGLIDENGQRYINWTYDCAGRATSSKLGSGGNKVTVSYTNGNVATTGVVTHYLGDPATPVTTTTNIGTSPVLNVSKVWTISQQCPECGPNSAQTFDANGNVSSFKNWSGSYTCMAYDLSRNLEVSRVEGTTSSTCSALSATSLTLPTRKISTQWHNVYRLPVAIAQPNKITNYSYDDFGNLLRRTEQATTDSTGVTGFNATLIGVPRSQNYTYNVHGQILIATGPRTDVADSVSYSYDQFGNLASRTNGLGQVTLYSDYDENGQLGTIIGANGIKQTLTYWPRGWLRSSTTSSGSVSETTNYEYDSVGQLTKIIGPDGTLTTYTYDDSHRLVAVGDSLGNMVRYKLDIRGNRVLEQSFDSSGALTRQISRTYDINNRLKQQTGE